MTDFGEDLQCVDDLTPNLTVISGPRVVIEAVVRRLQTPRGGLWYDPNYGTDLRQFINGAKQRFGIARAVEIEALKDERVSSATADVTVTDTTFTVDLKLTLAQGPFRLTIAVDELTVELIDFQQAA